jgi:predicted kinase
MKENGMLKKWVLILGFMFLTILVMGGSCGGGGPSARLGNVSDTSLSLTTEVGASATDFFTFENTGDATLTYTVTETLGFLEITSGASGSVQPSSTATVRLEVSCESVGNLNGTITIESNGGNVEIDVEIICTPPTAQLDNLSDTNLSLTAPVGSSADESFTFENVGQANLTYTTSTSAAFLEVIQGGSGTVAPGATATVTLEATCTAEGTRNGNVSVDSNGGDATVAVTLTCTPATVSGYAIQLSLADMTPAQENAFEDAAARWAEIITGDLADIAVNLPAEDGLDNTDPCFFPTPAFNGTIDDLLIFARIVDLPDPPGGNLLGRAGPRFVRIADELTVLGCMEFDVEDMDTLQAAGELDEVILHEMGHVLGIGTLWEPSTGFNSRNLLDAPCQSVGGAPAGFIGSASIDEFSDLDVDDLVANDHPPVEDGEGAGTRCAHWDEGFFGNELMTGFLNSGIPNPLSRLTIASLADLDYRVSLAQGESYALPSCTPSCLKLEPQFDQSWEVVLPPTGTIDSNGQITLFNDR